MYFKSEIGFSLMAGVRVCEYWKNLEIQCLAENITVHCYFYFCCVCELNYLHFFYSYCPEESRSSIAASIFMYSELCLGFSDCNSCVHTSFQCVWCGTGGCSYQRCRENSTNNAATVGREGTVCTIINTVNEKCTL